ncbi:Utp5 protein [Saccharomycopsis crataegensis]|uniref:Utp5 protein n=1 Tax=Saccharomycopsis crataegensis TaxID=43959 RepID=A0AAV5QPQ9_9ASCO|nr:Utp5 protein [Saccharomycopsis crataegensis]
MSSEIQSSFDPSCSLFASVVTALSSHKVQVQSVKSSSSSKLSTSFLLDKGVSVNSLDWGYVSGQTLENLILIVGTSDGKILLYSPVNNSLVDTLEDDIYTDAIVSVHYSNLSNSVWCINDANVIIEYSLSTFKKNKVIPNILKQDTITNDANKSHNDESLQCIKLINFKNSPHLLVSSHKVYLYNIKKKEISHEISNHITTITDLILFNDDYLLTSAKSDRFINIYNISNNFKPAKVLVTQSNVQNVSYGSIPNNKNSVVSVVTEDGICEIFYNPLESNSKANSGKSVIGDGTTRRKRRQSQGSLSRTSTSKIKISRPESTMIKEDALKLLDSIVLNNQVIITWLENATIPYFDNLGWYDQASNSFGFAESIVLTKEKPVVTQTKHADYGHDVAAAKLYSENNVFLNVGDNYRDLDEDNEDADTTGNAGFEYLKYRVNQNADDDSIMNETTLNEDPDETLGDKLQSMNPNSKALKKRNTFINNERNFNIDATGKSSKPTTGSLTIILSQALRSNDYSLLESVLSTKDEQVIKQTVKTLNSDLAIVLLDKLSEKYNFVSSVASSTISYQKQIQLNQWIKWVLIIHGSYLKLNEINSNSSNKQLLKNLSFLLSNLNKKSAQLSKILLLQSKMNVVFEKINYKNELLNDFNCVSEPFKRKKNRDLIVRYEENVDDQGDDEDEESDIEYNEELDDADLMDDGEMDYDDDDENDDDEEMVDDYVELEDDSDDEEIETITPSKKNKDSLDDEYGNDDVEVGIIRDEDEMVDSDEEEKEEYEEKIKELKKKSKSKSKSKSRK